MRGLTGLLRAGALACLFAAEIPAVKDLVAKIGIEPE